MEDKKQDDAILLKIYRQFTKDEAVGELILKMKERDVVIGQLKSEVEYLEYKLEELNYWMTDMNRYKKSYRQSMKDIVYKDIEESIKEENKNLLIKNRKLKKDYEDVLMRYTQLQLEIKNKT